MTEVGKKNNSTMFFVICNTYRHDRNNILEGAMVDFNNISAFVKKYFEHYYITIDVVKEKLDEKIENAVADIANNKDIIKIIFYYIGHGYQKVGAGELMPGFFTNDLKPLPYSYVISQISKRLADIKNTRINSLFAFIDACRTDITDRVYDYLPINNFTSFVFVSAVKENEGALEKRDGGYFTNALLGCLEKNKNVIDTLNTEFVLDTIKCVIQDKATVAGKINPTFRLNKYVRERYNKKVSELQELIEQTKRQIMATVVENKAMRNILDIKRTCEGYKKRRDKFKNMIDEKLKRKVDMDEYIKKNDLNIPDKFDLNIIQEKVKRYSIETDTYGMRRFKQYEHLLNIFKSYVNFKLTVIDNLSAEIKDTEISSSNIDTLLNKVYNYYNNRAIECRKQMRILLKS